jgi:maltose O-acetyltransferase
MSEQPAPSSPAKATGFGAAASTADARSEKEKMLAGDLYYAFTPQLVAERTAARHLVHAFNTELDEAKRLEVLRQLLGGFDEEQPPYIEPPLRVDYVSLEGAQ